MGWRASTGCNSITNHFANGLYLILIVFTLRPISSQGFAQYLMPSHEMMKITAVLSQQIATAP